MDKALKDKLDALAEKGIEVFEITVEAGVSDLDSEDFSEPASGYVQKPNNSSINRALAIMPKSVVEAGIVLLKGCWIGGDERILSDEAMLRGAATQMLEFIEIKKAKLKKI